MQHPLNPISLILCLALAGQTQADGRPAAPADYPSHAATGDCNMPALRKGMRDYNHARLDIAPVLRHMALGEPCMPAESRQERLNFAANLDEMRERLPEPDPDSTAFRNFDFHPGLTLAAMAVYLNTSDERLSARFVADRDNPRSELGRYLSRLDVSRQG